MLYSRKRTPTKLGAAIKKALIDDKKKSKAHKDFFEKENKKLEEKAALLKKEREELEAEKVVIKEMTKELEKREEKTNKGGKK